MKGKYGIIYVLNVTHTDAQRFEHMKQERRIAGKGAKEKNKRENVNGTSSQHSDNFSFIVRI